MRQTAKLTGPEPPFEDKVRCSKGFRPGIFTYDRQGKFTPMVAASVKPFLINGMQMAGNLIT